MRRVSPLTSALTVYLQAVAAETGEALLMLSTCPRDSEPVSGGLVELARQLLWTVMYMSCYKAHYGETLGDRLHALQLFLIASSEWWLLNRHL